MFNQTSLPKCVVFPGNQLSASTLDAFSISWTKPGGGDSGKVRFSELAPEEQTPGNAATEASVIKSPVCVLSSYETNHPKA